MQTMLAHFHHRWFLAVFLLCAAIILSSGVHFLIFRLLRRKGARSTTPGWVLQQQLGRPARAIFLLTCLLAALPAVPDLPARASALIHQGLVIALIVSLGWFAIGFVYVLQSIALRRYDLSAEDNMRARRVHTQLQIVRRLIISFLILVDAGAVLWSFDNPRLWHYGSGLLASAGVASLILATAAKSTASNLLAGIQIALTEPIRIDDVVVVQNEWGRIEEITSAYVVIKIWDLRRIIVPLTYFIENSFYNWSRHDTDIMGTAFLYVDYSIPVEALRQQLDIIVHASPLWDKKVCGLQVTNLTEHTMELRCLMSSRNSSMNFDLRCEVREKMTAWIQQNYPEAFPRTRFAALSPASPSSNPGLQPIGSHGQSTAMRSDGQAGGR
ncbi:MAG TPA: mechanosensitive ion channel domain-containing protein [Granulicella sp.]|jgi:small-conductance mechanosensitive channel|nr:mechanosensitive ion channel domain-containing protein [Granulicella sp.]